MVGQHGFSFGKDRISQFSVVPLCGFRRSLGLGLFLDKHWP